MVVAVGELRAIADARMRIDCAVMDAVDIPFDAARFELTRWIPPPWSRTASRMPRSSVDAPCLASMIFGSSARSSIGRGSGLWMWRWWGHGAACRSDGREYIGSEGCTRSGPGSEYPCHERARPCRSLLADRSLRPCGHVVPSLLRSLRSRYSAILLLRRHGQEHPRHLVREWSTSDGATGSSPLGGRRDHFRLSRREDDEPTVGAGALPDHPADQAHRADEEKPPDVGRAHLSRPPRALSSRPSIAVAARDPN